MVNLTHWYKEDYFTYLNQNFKNAVLALEYLVDDLHINKDKTLEKFINHVNKDSLIVGLVKLMASDNLRVSGNSAFVFGTIAETNEGIQIILNFLHNKSNSESKKVLTYLIKLLNSADYECMMNAAGTIGTISENNLGRSWLISQPLLGKIIQICVELLDNTNDWVSSNAALVIARITIEDEGCGKILNHELSSKILLKMAQSLGCDNIGRGMNCAFAIGRLCDTENGRQAFLALKDINNLIESLFEMIERNLDNGCTKNSCYALSCLAANQRIHHLILNNLEFNKLINTLCKLLTNASDPESQWFIAMLLRVFSNFSLGYLKLKKNESLWKTVNDVSKKKDLNNDVKEELNIILETFKPIEKPEILSVTVLSPFSVKCEWKALKCKAELTVEYHLFKNEEQVYAGSNLVYVINELEPNTEYSFSVQGLILENNENSVKSDQVTVKTEEAVPSEPENLKAIGSTTNIIRISWEPPSKPNGTIKTYIVYNGETIVEQTSDLSSTITGLQPETSYEIFVCACNNKGKGEKAFLKTSTCGMGDVLPDKPSFGMIGKREILVRWQPPKVISGKLTRYDLNMSSKHEKKCIYSGITTEYHVTMLRPDNEYKFEVVAITTEGKFKSKLAKIRTQKDEYDPERQPLYPGPIQNLNIQGQQNSPMIKERNESSQERRKNSFNDNSKIVFAKIKSKSKIVKEILPTMLCEEIDINQVKKLNSSSYNQNLESILTDSSVFGAQSSSHVTSNQHSSISSSKQFLPSLLHSKPSQNFKNDMFSDESLMQMDRPFPSFKRGKTDLKRNVKQNEILPVSKSPFTRSKSNLKMSPNLKKTDSPVTSQNFVQPTVFSFNITDISPKFPVLPLVATQFVHQSSCSTENRTNQSSFLNQSSIIQSRQSGSVNKPSSESRNSNKSEKKNDSDFQLQYRYLLNKINKSKNLDDSMGQMIRSNSYVNR